MSYGQNLVHGEGTSSSRVGPYRFCSGGTLYKPSWGYRFRVGPYRFCSDGYATTLSILLWSYLILSDTHIYKGVYTYRIQMYLDKICQYEESFCTSWPWNPSSIFPCTVRCCSRNQQKKKRKNGGCFRSQHGNNLLGGIPSPTISIPHLYP